MNGMPAQNLNRLAFYAVASSFFLSRFGVQITADFSLSFSYILLYIFLGVALTSGAVIFDFFRIWMYLLIVMLGGISFIFGSQEKSFTSYALLCFCYFPFCLKPAKVFSRSNLTFFLFRICKMILLFGILQFVLQFFISSPYLFDFKPLIPSFFQNKDLANTVIPISGFYKANGFFLTEPSGFSQLMSLGLFLTLFFNGGFSYLFLFFLGILLSFSGTGLLMLPIVFLFSFSRPFTRHSIVFVSLFCTFIFLLFFSDFSLIKDRINEFYSGAKYEAGSASQRFVNPVIVLKDSFSSSWKSLLIGNGPGSFLRQARDFDSHSPTWAKLPFEYGVLGTMFLLFFLFETCFRNTNNRWLCFLLFFQWLLLGGQLLSCDILAVFFLISAIYNNEPA